MPPTTAFTVTATDKLAYYVYRLVDPRDGRTFYVGKGSGNRIFGHEADIDDQDVRGDALLSKRRCLLDIQNAGFEVIRIIHRHGLIEETALEVEAALIDAYPGLTNVQGGYGSDERGSRHVDDIARFYELAEFVIPEGHRLLIISIGRSIKERTILDAVRYAWRLNRENAERCNYVIAHAQGVVVGVFTPTEWLDATPANFPGLSGAIPGRIGFNGDEAPPDVFHHYIGRQVPARYRLRGAMAPVRYS